MGDMMAQGTQLEHLPDTCLELIAGGVGTRDRRTLLPVLSRRWARLLQGPGPAWAEVKIYTGTDFPGRALPDPAAMLAWFARRAGSVRTLHVAGEVPRLPASLVATVLMSQAASLRELHLVGDAAQYSRMDYAALVSLTRMERLSIAWPEQDEEWDGRNRTGAAVIRTLSGMPALTVLTVVGTYGEDGTRRPTMAELSALQSPTLAQMTWTIEATAAETLILGALPALESCILEAEERDDALHVTPGSFSKATGLTRLTLRDFSEVELEPRCFRGLKQLEELVLSDNGLLIMPADIFGPQNSLRRLYISLEEGSQLLLNPCSFSGLSRLEDLSLRDCGQTEIPAALSRVQHSLRRLDLSSNHKLEISQAGFGILLALRRLEWVDLRTSRRHWKAKSTSFLAKFLVKWQKRHPEAPMPDLKV